jgi:hypothetical protein
MLQPFLELPITNTAAQVLPDDDYLIFYFICVYTTDRPRPIALLCFIYDTRHK